ncbi:MULTISPECIES: TetR/AcrR family transcriptional regulator [unclassified Pseudomonas]|uniref:TetR/AcrR family transcriptional regulator n=1 Tax=unclassified Pseudomonas TaxID=196821 RepID=UPI0024486E91|nr:MULTISPECIES: TetR/AcrR family transcriptional regulator [unclassified Pseudomonas]MDG9930583.1 TetR/AcrR family transcriptional regulator [Pseudomonas sp. GD04042]MDH0485080.1 TetR/AcrR family transcriptional regulator [Pseudomonas sp. GD04015]MDH0605740.1 TetR/AcrR family transcriptional regulator [Pseudomonas sp. GD03869]MDH0893049.1 TetR/AcrR family transcriptional regulator [Pseudomonas sp. GD03875]MDH1066192.1 TetR/AcrR family transcriptional regulator [Pseudomonas sp. GD03985]
MAVSIIQKRIHEAALQLFAQKELADVNVSELAQKAGLARNTIYKNLESIETLFETVATELASEMNERVGKSAAPGLDPAQRLSNGIRFYIRRAHEEHNWGSFLLRYGASHVSMQALWDGPPVRDVLEGLASQRYSFRQDQLLSAIGLIAGAVLSAISLVLQGHKTWRDAGADTAEFVLRGLGVPADEARAFATAPLPELPTLDD